MSTRSKQETPLAKRLKRFGCSDYISLEGDDRTPEQLNYLDLLAKRGATRQPVPISAVVEHQGVTLLYLVNDPQDSLTQADRTHIQKVLANRSDPAWLGILKFGSLEVYPIGFPSVSKVLNKVVVIEDGSAQAPLFFQSLAQGTLDTQKYTSGADYVFQKIFKLLSRTSQEFVPNKILDPISVLSMAGRALFFRFLIDRKIVLPKELDEISEDATDLKDVFASPEKAALTSLWLDETFNGDFLSLIDESIPVRHRNKRYQAYLEFYQSVDGKTKGLIFTHLTAILRGWQVVGTALQSELDWGDLDFAHIPVGVLSQVYESFSHLNDSEKARGDSVHYTPRIVAQLMVDQALSSAKSPASARILDPSCGAGIFLVLAFRRLFFERWKQDGERPNYTVIQDILYKQLSGFEISESALRLGALALYITAIELNASPRPPKSLKFPKNLRSSVLHHFGQSPSDTEMPELGSLDDAVAEEFAGCFDIVIGNPPWTRKREAKPETTDAAIAAKKKTQAKTVSEILNEKYTQIGRDALQAKGLSDLAKRYVNPDKNPDLPFIWRATRWAKENGIIVFALPARIFIRSSKEGKIAWESILKSVSVTGLINGANLRKTGVWRDVDFPWCVLFAKNHINDENAMFHFLAPEYDSVLNSNARFRIDYESACAVEVQETLEKPWLLKALSIGNRGDVRIMDKILNSFPGSLAEVWGEFDATGKQKGQGYNRSPNLTQKPAEFLLHYPDFERPRDEFSLAGIYFKTFEENRKRKTLHGPRHEALYQPPLVIIPEAPDEYTHTPKAFISRVPMAFSKSFYGYSTKGHACSETFSCLIYLIAHSMLFRYHCLMTSNRLGFDRQTIYKKELDGFPFPRIEDLPKHLVDRILSLNHSLENDATKPWQSLNELIYEIYGLNESESQFIEDTLFSSACYRKQGKAAFHPTDSENRSAFADRLSHFLSPFFDVCGESLSVENIKLNHRHGIAPWTFLALSKASEPLETKDHQNVLELAMAMANESGSSRVIVHTPANQGLIIGLLNQQRWWTLSRAKLCGQYILNNHLDAFGLSQSGGSE